MTKKDLINRLKHFDKENVVIISDGKGWCNIKKIEQHGNTIVLIQEKYPVFSDN